MLGQLIPVGGGDPIPLDKPSLMVGRRPSCDIRLDFSNVSSHHCRLEYINGYWRAADISRNGTKVNGERIDEKFLQPGDTVCFAGMHLRSNTLPIPTPFRQLMKLILSHSACSRRRVSLISSGATEMANTDDRVLA